MPAIFRYPLFAVCALIATPLLRGVGMRLFLGVCTKGFKKARNNLFFHARSHHLSADPF